MVLCDALLQIIGVSNVVRIIGAAHHVGKKWQAHVLGKSFETRESLRQVQSLSLLRTNGESLIGIRRDAILDRAGYFLEVFGFGEIAVDAGETDVSHGIERAKSVHHHFTDHGSGDFGFA